MNALILSNLKYLFLISAMTGGLCFSQASYAQLGDLFNAIGKGLQAIGKSLNEPAVKQEEKNITVTEGGAPESKENKEKIISESNMGPEAAQSEADTKSLPQCDSDLPATQWSDCIGVFTQSHTGRQYEGEFRDGKPNGKGSSVRDGTKYTGEWKDGEPEGRGIANYKSGARYEGEWLNGKKSGMGIAYYPDGSRYEGGWLDDLRSGHGVFYQSSGNSLDANWVNDKPHGSATVYEKQQNRTSHVELNNGKRVETGESENQATVDKNKEREPGQALAMLGMCFEGARKDGFGIQLLVRRIDQEDLCKKLDVKAVQLLLQNAFNLGFGYKLDQSYRMKCPTPFFSGSDTCNKTIVTNLNKASDNWRKNRDKAASVPSEILDSAYKQIGFCSIEIQDRKTFLQIEFDQEGDLKFGKECENKKNLSSLKVITDGENSQVNVPGKYRMTYGGGNGYKYEIKLDYRDRSGWESGYSHLKRIEERIKDERRAVAEQRHLARQEQQKKFRESHKKEVEEASRKLNECLGNTGVGVCVTSVRIPSKNICSNWQQAIANPDCQITNPYILQVSYVIKNNTNTPVKDIRVNCEQMGRSGTRLRRDSHTSYDIWQPNESKTISIEIMRHDQVNHVNCNVIR